MATRIPTKSRYAGFKKIFKEETGLDANTNVSDYIAYYNARVNDEAVQVLLGVTTALLDKLDELKDELETIAKKK